MFISITLKTKTMERPPPNLHFPLGNCPAKQACLLNLKNQKQ
jgi:hypothetical protein